ncbi:MAG: long-chain fatty acid--CoA ligase [Acidimicrobiia bacterium]|nr:long-chain fatty acid--CoA ligase [Acidimicrobiia bacterium]
MISKAEIDQAVEGDTITSRFLATVQAHPDHVALRSKQADDTYAEWTYQDYATQVAAAAAYLRSIGVVPGSRVVLMMRNCPDFHFVDLAVAFLGATSISIYNSSSAEQIAYVAGHCDATCAVVEDDGFEQRFNQVRDQLPLLTTILNLASEETTDALYHSGSLDLLAEVGNSTPATLATVIYTSGTTGPPKGVMLDHHNVVWTGEGYLRMLDVEPVGFRAVSYLPMAHIAERMSTHYLALMGGYEVTTCPDPGQIASYTRDIHPEIFFGVPRVWEKFHAGVQAALSADPAKKQGFDGAVATAIPISERRTLGTASAEDDATWKALDEAVFAGVRALLGLDAVIYGITGAAPIPAELIRWFRAIGVPLSEIYGMSESSGPITWEPTRVKAGTVGVAFPGTEVFLAEDGEVCTRGSNVFRGYLNDPEKTAEALDADGTLHSGDIGVFDDEGYLLIVDRKKELIITAGGKNISPANLEAALKTIPLVSQACAIGDNRPFVSALVVLDGELAPVWAKEHGIDGASLAELAQHPAVIAEINAGLETTMARFNNAERVKKVSILSTEWLADSDELTPTSKLKRRGVHAKYAAEIAALYA